MVSIEQIKELRERTGISLGACKKALAEAEGDMDKAIELLRKKGAAKAAERSERDAGEGTVVIVGDAGKKAMVKLACETDFVARSDEFIAAATGYAEKFLANGVDFDLGSEVTDLGIKLGEKIELADKAVVEADMVGAYVHSNSKIGVLVAFAGSVSEEHGTDVAMHVAAVSPKVVSPDEVSDELVAKEKEIWTEQLKQEGKPENIMDNILAGKEKKFRSEAALLTQPFVKNPEQTVGEHIGEAKVTNFIAFRI